MRCSTLLSAEEKKAKELLETYLDNFDDLFRASVGVPSKEKYKFKTLDCCSSKASTDKFSEKILELSKLERQTVIQERYFSEKGVSSRLQSKDRWKLRRPWSEPINRGIRGQPSTRYNSQTTFKTQQRNNFHSHSTNNLTNPNCNLRTDISQQSSIKTSETTDFIRRNENTNICRKNKLSYRPIVTNQNTEGQSSKTTIQTVRSNTDTIYSTTRHNNTNSKFLNRIINKDFTSNTHFDCNKKFHHSSHLHNYLHNVDGHKDDCRTSNIHNENITDGKCDLTHNSGYEDSSQTKTQDRTISKKLPNIIRVTNQYDSTPDKKETDLKPPHTVSSTSVLMDDIEEVYIRRGSTWSQGDSTEDEDGKMNSCLPKYIMSESEDSDKDGRAVSTQQYKQQELIQYQHISIEGQHSPVFLGQQTQELQESQHTIINNQKYQSQPELYRQKSDGQNKQQRQEWTKHRGQYNINSHQHLQYPLPKKKNSNKDYHNLIQIQQFKQHQRPNSSQQSNQNRKQTVQQCCNQQQQHQNTNYVQPVEYHLQHLQYKHDQQEEKKQQIPRQRKNSPDKTSNNNRFPNSITLHPFCEKNENKDNGEPECENIDTHNDKREKLVKPLKIHLQKSNLLERPKYYMTFVKS